MTSTGESHRKVTGLGLRFQLILALVLPAILVLAAMTYFADLAVRRALDEALGERLSAVASAAAALVSPRVLLLEEGEDESRTAARAKTKLDELAKSTGVEQFLVLSLEQGTRVVIDSTGATRLGEAYGRASFDGPELERVAQGQRVASVLFRGPDQRWYKTGYAPLPDESGAIRGAIVVNAPADFFAAIDEMRMTLLVIVVVGFLALVMLASLAARGITQPLSRLSASASRIGRGELTTEIPLGGPKEAQVLSQTMRTMAESLSERDEEMQVMLAGIAHEVRNPLGGIELFGGLLKEDLEDGDPRRRHVDKILKEIGVLAGVVNDFLDFARKHPLEPKVVELHDLLDEVCSLVGKSAEEKSIEIEIRAPERLELVLDRDSMARAVLNLVRNAVQAAPESGHVLVEASADKDGGAELSVSDDGPGIDEDQIEEIFAPFFTTKQKGTGLGLALVKKSVDAHGGSVRVEKSELGGARFVIAIPKIEPQLSSQLRQA